MYKCERCEEVFDEPKQIKELMGEYWGIDAYEYWSVCPCCGSYEFEEYDEDDEDEHE